MRDADEDPETGEALAAPKVYEPVSYAAGAHAHAKTPQHMHAHAHSHMHAHAQVPRAR